MSKYCKHRASILDFITYRKYTMCKNKRYQLLCHRTKNLLPIYKRFKSLPEKKLRAFIIVYQFHYRTVIFLTLILKILWLHYIVFRYYNLFNIKLLGKVLYVDQLKNMWNQTSSAVSCTKINIRNKNRI